MKHFLDIEAVSLLELNDFLSLAHALKKGQVIDQNLLLEGCSLGMVFEKPSLRTRLSFEMAMHQAGGKAVFLTNQELGLGVRESVSDVARVLSRYVDSIMLRTFSHDRLKELAEYADVPVINGLSDYSHPCQALADVMTIQEQFGMNLKDLKIVFLGDFNNVSRSLCHMALVLGFELVLCCPERLKRDIDLPGITLSHHPKEAVHGAHVIYTDVWVSMGQESESEARLDWFSDFQVTSDLMQLADQRAIFLHCLPAIRGQEVTHDVIEGNQSHVFDQAENRLHAQKAVLFRLLLDQNRIQIKD